MSTYQKKDYMAQPTDIQENREKLLKYERIVFQDKNYIAVEETPVEGDLVVDCQDCCVGICDLIVNDKMALTDENGFSAELGVPFSRVLKLVPEVQEF